MSAYGDEAFRRLEYNDVVRENGLLLTENDTLRAEVEELEEERDRLRELIQQVATLELPMWVAVRSDTFVHHLSTVMELARQALVPKESA